LFYRKGKLYMTDTTAALPETADLLYGVPAISRFLGLKPAAVYHLVAEKKIPAFKIGKTVCARRASLLEAFERMEGAQFDDRAA
jgi:hypothetical protein